MSLYHLAINEQRRLLQKASSCILVDAEYTLSAIRTWHHDTYWVVEAGVRVEVPSHGRMLGCRTGRHRQLLDDVRKLCSWVVHRWQEISGEQAAVQNTGMS